jgi:hypothetical protein
MKLSRRTFNRGVGIAAAVVALVPLRGLAESAIPEPEPVVISRAAAVVLSARETQVVLMPVRQRQTKARPRAKGGKPAPPRTQLVFRDVVAGKAGPAYDVFLVVEGPNVFQATSARIEIGALEFAQPAGDKPVSIALPADEALAKVSKLRGFTRNMRVAIVRRAVKDGKGTETVPPDPVPPEIGAIELVRQ